VLGASTAIVKLPAALRFTERSGLDMVLVPAWYFRSTQRPCAYLNCWIGSLLATGNYSAGMPV